MLCPSSETTIWILYRPCPSLLSSPTSQILFPPQVIIPDLAFQLLLTGVSGCIVAWLMDSTLCSSADMLEMCQTKGSAFWWLGQSQCWWRTCTSGESCVHTWVWSSTTFCSWRTLLTACFSKQERSVDNTLKSKLANTRGVLMHGYCT